MWAPTVLFTALLLALAVVLRSWTAMPPPPRPPCADWIDYADRLEIVLDEVMPLWRDVYQDWVAERPDGAGAPPEAGSDAARPMGSTH